MQSATDVIRRSTVVTAPLDRVWAAISDAHAFGRWFGASFDGPFVVGHWLHGRIVPTTVDPEVAALQAPHAGVPLSVFVEAIEPSRRLAFRWHPYPAGPDRDASPTTLVEFVLEPVSDGVRLTITESGFDRVPLEHRAAAFTGNEGGWTHQVRLVATYVTCAQEA